MADRPAEGKAIRTTAAGVAPTVQKVQASSSVERLVEVEDVVDFAERTPAEVDSLARKAALAVGIPEQAGLAGCRVVGGVEEGTSAAVQAGREPGTAADIEAGSCWIREAPRNLAVP